MNIGEALAMEMQYESQNTKKVLERLPEDKFDFKPHEKSMTLGQLASHLAEIYGWADMTLNLDSLDFDASTYVPWVASSRGELIQKLEETTASAVPMLQGASNETMTGLWTFSMNGQQIFQLPRVGVVRSMMLSHAIHHRAQLTVYLRLLDVPLPAIYGPSADEQV